MLFGFSLPQKTLGGFMGKIFQVASVFSPPSINEVAVEEKEATAFRADSNSQ